MVRHLAKCIHLSLDLKQVNHLKIILYFTLDLLYFKHFKQIHLTDSYFLLQVWCVESEEERYQNWTVNSSQQKLDISALKPGKQYWITVAAVNGAGVGTPSDPHGFLISELINLSSMSPVMSPYVTEVCVLSSDPQKTGSSHSDLSWGLTLLQDPLLIGGIGALLWCTLMIAAVWLFRRHGKTGRLLPRHGRSKGGP